ncbi:MAG: hypothetical protein VXW65_14100 [Pseudomonadota bacterium]|nr:hypothetical protein [Pseudomonadota bacterium]
MSAFDSLKSLLTRYRALEHHHNTLLAEQLNAVQVWQKNRMQTTHHDLFTQPNHLLMAEYFLNRLYGGAEFNILAGQFERVLEKTKKLEKIVPDSAISTGTLGIELAVLAIELDEQLATLLLGQQQHIVEPDDARMLAAYQQANQAEQRIHQMALLNELGQGLDKYVRSFMIQTAFKMAKNTAYKHDFAPVYDFTAEGFAAMKPLTSAADFIAGFTAQECEIIDRVHTNHPDPFKRWADLPTSALES